MLEGIPLAGRRDHASLAIPTIGIGAGVHCDGQVLVLHDVLGLSGRDAASSPSATATLAGEVVARRHEPTPSEVRTGGFPADAHSFH